jgi:hypothetical protein
MEVARPHNIRMSATHEAEGFSREWRRCGFY